MFFENIFYTSTIVYIEIHLPCSDDFLTKNIERQKVIRNDLETSLDATSMTDRSQVEAINKNNFYLVFNYM